MNPLDFALVADENIAVIFLRPGYIKTSFSLEALDTLPVRLSMWILRSSSSSNASRTGS